MVPKNWAKTPPRSMSPTTTTGSCAARAMPMFTMSVRRRLISAGLPAPSQITASYMPRSSSRHAMTGSKSSFCRPPCSAFPGDDPPDPPKNPRALSSPTGLPIRTTWLERSLPGLSSTGFIRAVGSTRAACACMAWARPISAPSRVTKELRDMFCPLNGATFTPLRTSQRQMPAVTTLLPASDVVPATRRPPPLMRSSASQHR
ncbi:hypothetical protein SNARM312S_04026 [Streptomyces narbonensis]